MLRGSHKYVKELDGLRGLAILLIIAYHSIITFLLLYPKHGENLGVATNFILKIVSLFWCGVDLFFVISGFLITTILLHNKESKNYFRAFYARRILRIFPLYYCFLCIHFFVITPLLINSGVKEELTGYSNQFYYWFYLSNFTREPTAIFHFWSLAVEEQFYLIWPLFVYFLSKRQLVWTCYGVIAISFISRLILAVLGDFSYAYTALYARSDTIMMGSLIAILNIKVENKNVMKIVLGSLIAFLLLYSTYLFDFTRPMTTSFPVLEKIFHSTFRHCIIGVMISAIMIFLLKEQKTTIHKIFMWSPLQIIGKYSYSIYVCHVFVVFGIAKSPLGFESLQALGIPTLIAIFLQFVICSLLSLLIAIGTWHLLEIHFLKYKKKFSY